MRDKNKFSEANATADLHGQWYPVQKLQVLLSIPYIYDKENVPSSSVSQTAARPSSVLHDISNETHQLAGSSTKGIGDPVLLMHYQLFNKAVTDSALFAHRLVAGGGMKFPLGSYKIQPGEEAAERVHLPGSGSWDWLLSAVYLVKMKRVGCNVNVSYLVAAENKQSFRFGNRFNANTSFYYQVNAGQFSFFPNVGVFYELADKSKSGNFTMVNSGGSIIFTSGGMDVYYRKFSLNCSVHIPAAQKLNENQPHVQYRLRTGITYAIN